MAQSEHEIRGFQGTASLFSLTETYRQDLRHDTVVVSCRLIGDCQYRVRAAYGCGLQSGGSMAQNDHKGLRVIIRVEIQLFGRLRDESMM